MGEPFQSASASGQQHIASSTGTQAGYQYTADGSDFQGMGSWASPEQYATKLVEAHRHSPNYTNNTFAITSANNIHPTEQLSPAMQMFLSQKPHQDSWNHVAKNPSGNPT